MYACGLRIGEATRLEIRSVDRANQVLRIIGKGDKERLVLLPQPVLDEFGTVWRTHRNPRWLFPNRCGDGPLDQRVLSHTFAAAADAAGLRHGVTSHALRHSYATRLIENGVDIRVVPCVREREQRLPRVGPAFASSERGIEPIRKLRDSSSSCGVRPSMARWTGPHF
jgi:site-specific recombinase XerD